MLDSLAREAHAFGCIRFAPFHHHTVLVLHSIIPFSSTIPPYLALQLVKNVSLVLQTNPGAPYQTEKYTQSNVLLNITFVMGHAVIYLTDNA